MAVERMGTKREATKRSRMALPRRRLLCLSLLTATTAVAGAKPGDRPLLIPVDPLGFQMIPTRFQSTGATMFTLHFVDEDHLLFTFNKRTLMPRLPDADPNDDDRNVEAVLLNLPDGKVLARNQWRTRDRDRYLWPLEHGRFLLRQRTKLTIIDPLRNFERQGAADAFRQEAFLELSRPIGYVAVSPGGDLLGIETIPPRKPKLTGAKADAAALAATVAGYKPAPQAEDSSGHAPVQIHFFRMLTEKTGSRPGEEKLVARTAGTVGAPNLISLPATGDGYLDIKRESAQVWLFDFVSHTGKRLELSPYDTSCAPRPYWVSRSEFVAFGCRGAQGKQELSYFNLKGEQPWLSVLQGSFVSPLIVSSPAGGRFAMSRTLIANTVFDTENLTADDLTGQEISVESNLDGRQLLKVLATPIQRVGQNFDLSPSGTQFAVLHAGNLEVYRLPELNGKETKAVKLAEALAPEKNEAVVRMGAVPVAAIRAEEAAKTTERPADSIPTPAPPRPVPAAVPAPLPSAEAVQSESHAAPAKVEGAPTALGDQPQAGPRKPPSLYSSDHPREKGDAPASTPTDPK